MPTSEAMATGIGSILPPTPQNRQSQIKELSDCYLHLCLSARGTRPVYFMYAEYCPLSWGRAGELLATRLATASPGRVLSLTQTL